VGFLFWGEKIFSTEICSEKQIPRFACLLQAGSE